MEEDKEENGDDEDDDEDDDDDDDGEDEERWNISWIPLRTSSVPFHQHWKDVSQFTHVY